MAQTEPTIDAVLGNQSVGKRSESGGTPDGCGVYFPLQSNGFAAISAVANPPIHDWRVNCTVPGKLTGPPRRPAIMGLCTLPAHP